MKESFTEFNDLLKECLDEVRQGKEIYSYYIASRAIELAIRKIVGDVEEAVLPITIGYSYRSQRGSNYVIKTKGTSTKLITVELDYHYEGGNWQDSKLIIDRVESFKESKLASSLDELEVYLKERINKLEVKQNSKEAPIRQELNALGIEIKDFVNLYKIYERLDAPTRRKLWKEGNE